MSIGFAPNPARFDDEELLAAIRTGDRRAYGELWKRHSRAGLRAAQSFKHLGEPDDLVAEAFILIYEILRSGGGPTGAFRPYLYATIRNLSFRNMRQLASIALEDLEAIAAPEVEHGSTEIALDRAMTATAFRSLPARWQTVLWFTEVERMSAIDAGVLMGLKPNAVGALAFRARSALRGAWLQSHINDETLTGEHKLVLAKVGEYAQGTLGVRDQKRIDDHLKTCVRCSIIVEEVEEVAGRLAIIMLPLVLGGAGALIFAHSIASGAALPMSSALPPAPASGSTFVGSTGGSAGSAAAGSSGGAGLSLASVALIAAAAVVVVGGGAAATWAITQSNMVQPATQSPDASSQQAASPDPVAPSSTPVPAPVSSVTPAPETPVNPPVTVKKVLSPNTAPVASTPATVLPTLAPPSLAVHSVLVNQDRYTIAGTGTPGATIRSSGTTVATVDPSGGWTFPMAGLPEGVTQVALTQQLSGWSDSNQELLSITVDTVAPLQPFVTTTWTSTHQFAPQFAGTGEPGATIVISSLYGTILGKVVVDSNGVWRPGALDGFLPTMSGLTVTQTDLAGNASPPEELGPFAFVPLFTAPLDASTPSAGDVVVTLSGWPGASVALTINSDYLGSFTLDSAGSLSQAISSDENPLPPGTYTLTATYLPETQRSPNSAITFTIAP